MLPAPRAVSLVTCSYTVIERTCRIAARARRSRDAPAAGGQGTSSDVVPPVQPVAVTPSVRRLSPRAHLAGATTQPGPQPRTAATASTPASVPASILVASAGPAPGAGRWRSHLRPASASAAAAPTRAAFTIRTQP